LQVAELFGPIDMIINLYYTRERGEGVIVRVSFGVSRRVLYNPHWYGFWCSRVVEGLTKGR